MVKRIGFIAEIRGKDVNGNRINFSWLGPSKESSHQVLGDMQSDKLMRGWDKDRCVQGFVDAYDSYLEVEIYPVSVQNTIKESFQYPDTAFKITESIVSKMRAMEMIGKRGVSLIKFGGTIVFQTKENKIERYHDERGFLYKLKKGLETEKKEEVEEEKQVLGKLKEELGNVGKGKPEWEKKFLRELKKKLEESRAAA